MNEPLVVANPWQALRRFTDARIALGRTGVSLPTEAHLAFQLAHARARDAVHHPLDVSALCEALRAADAMPGAGALETVLDSAAGDRFTYLQRPDLGRRLDAASRDALDDVATGSGRFDIAFVVVDGLSARAVEQNAAPLLAAVLPRMQADGGSIAPLAIVRQGRVAIGDEIGERLRADAIVVLIGERPGLSSPDSLGVYLTWQPRVGLTDAARNCISNVRPGGLGFADAAHRLHYLLTEARLRRLSGIGLKDETPRGSVRVETDPDTNFLLAKTEGGDAATVRAA